MSTQAAVLWSTTLPEKEGWYFWRPEPETPPHIVHVWKNGTRPRDRIPRYPWLVGTLLVKEMHAERPLLVDEMYGEWLKVPNQGPIRIVMPGEPVEEDPIEAKYAPKEPTPAQKVEADQPVRRKGAAKGKQPKTVQDGSA